MIKKTMIVLLAGTALFTACKKTDTAATTTAQKVLGKWTFVSKLTREKFQGTWKSYNITGQPGDYADFRTDGKLYSYANTEYDTSSYAIISDKLLKFNKDTFQINTLTTNSFVIYQSDFATKDSSDVTTTLKR